MSIVSSVLLAATLLLAFGDWYSVAAAKPAAEYWFKPLTLIAMIALAVTLDHHDDQGLAVKVFFVVALFASLLGDILLMLPKEQFLGGLGMFLVAHIAYVGGLVIAGQQLVWWLTGVAVLAVALGVIGRRILSAAAQAEPKLKVPVAIYIGVISLMVACAIGTAVPLAIVGALLFMVSDALLGGGKFIGEVPGGRVAVHVTYHLGQLALVLSLPALTEFG